MSSSEILTTKEREFFSLVKEASLNPNPFSDERIALDLKIAGDDPDRIESHEIEKTVQNVESMIKVLEENKRDNINSYTDSDRDLVVSAILFLFFFRFRKDFDKLIHSQMDAGDKPIKLSFADEAISFLRKKGFEQENIKRVFEEAYQLRRAYYFLKRNLIGRSPIMRKIRFDLWNNIFTCNFDLYQRFLWNRMEDFSTLILGKTGTGKGTVATAIGCSGYIPFDIKKQRFTESFTKTFISINLSQFPESLIESELFGHKKGAFTGAVENYKGVFERCSQYGSILLDEIGEISMPIQIKLLQVLQERIFYSVGSHKKERFHGRVIAATNRSIDELRGKEIFRDDFYYRLCSDIIVVPSLKERIQEDPRELDDLLSFMVGRMIGRDSPELCEMVRDVIDKKLGNDYPWYGNVRELEQCVRRVVLKKNYEGEKTSMKPGLKAGLQCGIENGDITAHHLIAGYCKLLYDRYGTFEEVARRAKLDRRTVNKYIKEWNHNNHQEVS